MGESTEEQLYAVDITDSQFVSSLPINHNTKSIEIGVLGGDEPKEKIMQFVKHIAEEGAAQ
ncbi:hypothetical protein D3C78_1605200 [compost metagenome]